MTQSILTGERVRELMLDCLYQPDELAGGSMPADAVRVQAIITTLTFALHPARLESHRDEIKRMLRELPDQFQANLGGGWSFLNACETRDGVQWGEHGHMEALFAMAIGLGLAEWQFPREVWSILPGGVPYVVVHP